MLTRRRLLAGTLAGALGMSAAATAQQGEKVYRVGYLGGQSESVDGPFLDAFRHGMQRLGYVEGRNLVIVARFASGQFDRFPALAHELVGLNPDALFVATVVGSRAAKAATITIPIIFVQVGDPVGVGLVPNLARPGGNLTGITNIVAELTGKRLELLKEIVPSASRIAIIANPDAPIAALQIRNAEAAARTLGLQLRPVLTVRDARTLAAAFQAAVRSGATAALRMVDFVAKRASGDLGGQSPPGNPSRRSADRAANQVRACHQCQDCQSPWPHHPALAAGAGRSGHRMISRRVSHRDCRG